MKGDNAGMAIAYCLLMFFLPFFLLANIIRPGTIRTMYEIPDKKECNEKRIPGRNSQ